MYSPQISLFRSQIEKRRLEEETIGVLESILASEDVKSLIDVRSSLKEFMRNESLRIVREIAGKSVYQKLLVVDFLVQIFALIGDFECCLALRYEALLMRERYATSHGSLQVSQSEWFTFAEHALRNGFCSIARKACEKALSCLDMIDPGTRHSCNNMTAVEKIKELKDIATISASLQSVRSLAVDHLKKRTREQVFYHSSCIETKCPGSKLFRNGLKRRNIMQLYKHQKLEQNAVQDTLQG